MDVLQQFVVVLDYPHRRWALADHEFDDAGLREAKSWPFQQDSFGGAYVTSHLSNGAQLRLLLDTAADGRSRCTSTQGVD
jgi:hypothetical protein